MRSSEPVTNPDAEEEWSGGGYGKYQGIPLKEIRRRFAACEADPSMRSISAVLRITREQLESRGQLGIYPVLSGTAAVVAVAALIALPMTTGETHALAEKSAMGASAVAVLLLIGVLRVRHARRSNAYQENQIRVAAVASLNVILAAEPTLKPLEREQVATVRELLKKVRPSGSIARLLE